MKPLFSYIELVVNDIDNPFMTCLKTKKQKMSIWHNIYLKKKCLLCILTDRLGIISQNREIYHTSRLLSHM